MVKRKVRAKASEVVPKLFTKPWCLQATRGDAIQKVYWEEKNPGFGFRVGARAKTFFVQRTVNGTTVTQDIGSFPEMDPEEARRLAKTEVLPAMGRGEDPRAEKRKQAAQGITLREAQELWKSDGKVGPRTISDNEYLMSHYLSDWLDEPLMAFGDDDGRKVINERYRKIVRDVAAGKYDKRKQRPSKGRTGATTAANVFRHYRLLWRRAMKQSSALPVCPTINIAFPKYEARKAGIPLMTWPRGTRASRRSRCSSAAISS